MNTNATLIEKSEKKLYGFYMAKLELDSGETVIYKEHRENVKIGERASYSLFMGMHRVDFPEKTKNNT